MDDDFAAFLSEIKEVKPGEGGGGEATASSSAAGTSEGISPGKRPREEERQQQEPAERGGESLSKAQPVLKKAKVVVASAKPQIRALEPEEEPEPYAPIAAKPYVHPNAYGASHHGYGQAIAGQGMGSTTTVPPAPSASQYHQPSSQYNSSGAAMVGSSSNQPTTSTTTTTNAASAGTGGEGGKSKKPKKILRIGGGPNDVWEDATLNEWPDNDFRLFCGDLGNEVTDEILAQAFRNKYPSFAKAKVVRDKFTGKSKGYGFISFVDPFEGLKAFREMNYKYIGSRPVKLRKSDWKERTLHEVKKKEKNKKKFLKKLGLA